MTNDNQPLIPSNQADLEITDLIESGQYYKDALNWYKQIYLRPYSERSITAILMIIVVLAATPLMFSFNGLYPLTQSVPFVIWSRNSDDYYPELKKLAENIDNAESVLAQHFLTNYIRDREEYNPINPEANDLQSSRVSHSSSRRVLWQYEASQDPSNPESSSAKYGFHTARKVDWVTIRFPKGQTKLGHAVARFQVVEKSANNQQNSVWDVDISFRFTDLKLVLKERKPLQLSVTNYELRRVK